MISIVANFSEKLPVLFFCLHGHCVLATTFSSLRFLFNFTSLQSCETGQRGFLFSHFRVLSSILSLSFLCSSVSEALFILSFSFLSERFFFVMIKLLQSVVEIYNTGVTGQSLSPKNDFEHARGLRNPAYAVNLTYETYIYIYHAKSRLNTPVWGSHYARPIKNHTASTKGMTRELLWPQTSSYFALLCILGSLSQQEDGEGRSLGSLGHVDDLLESRHPQGHVLGGHSSVVECVEGHQCGRLPQTLGSKSSHHLTWLYLLEHKPCSMNTATLCQVS